MTYVYSDASESRYGGYVIQTITDIVAQVKFTPEEECQNSTYRELIAVKFVWQSVGSHLKIENIHWLSDNLVLAFVIEIMSFFTLTVCDGHCPAKIQFSKKAFFSCVVLLRRCSQKSRNVPCWAKQIRSKVTKFWRGD